MTLCEKRFNPQVLRRRPELCTCEKQEKHSMLEHRPEPLFLRKHRAAHKPAVMGYIAYPVLVSSDLPPSQCCPRRAGNGTAAGSPPLGCSFNFCQGLHRCSASRTFSGDVLKHPATALLLPCGPQPLTLWAALATSGGEFSTIKALQLGLFQWKPILSVLTAC